MQLIATLIGSAMLLFSTGWALGPSIHISLLGEQSTDEFEISVPLSMAETLLPLVRSHRLRSGRLQLEDQEYRVSELREIWESMKQESDGEILSLRAHGSAVDVFLADGALMARSREGSEATIQVRIPVPVVDALLSGPGEELNAAAALGALKGSGSEELVYFEDQERILKVWIGD